MYQIPQICRTAICISSNAKLAAIISSWFHHPQEYFTVLESPRTYLLVREREIIQRTNAIAKINPKWVILAGLRPEILQELKSSLPAQRLVIIENEDQIFGLLSKIAAVPEEKMVVCRSTDLAKGLLLAKAKKSRLEVNDQAAPITLENPDFRERKHLIYLSDFWGVVPVLTANFAFAINATIEYGDKIDGKVAEHVCESLLTRSIYAGDKRGVAAKQLISESLSRFDLSDVVEPFEFVTYVSQLIPFGYFTPSRPSTHLLSLRFLGLTICESIIYALSVNCIRSMVIIDPQFFDESETAIVSKMCQSQGTAVRWVRGNNATVHNTRMHIQYFPYDLLFICSHAGQVSGTRYTIRVYDKTNQAHTVVLDSVFEMAVPEGKIEDDTKIEVMDFRVFISFDGKDWSSSDKDNYQWPNGLLFEQFTNSYPKDWDIVDSHVVPYVQGSFRIECKDGCCPMAMHVLADHESPFIFNNSCSSVHSMAAHGFNSGAISYVGTLFPVESEKAQQIAERIFAAIDDTRALPLELWEAQNETYKNWDERPYIHYGCHFLAMHPPESDQTSNLKIRIMNGHAHWSHYLKHALLSEQAREVTKQIVDFLGKIEL